LRRSAFFKKADDRPLYGKPMICITGSSKYHVAGEVAAFIAVQLKVNTLQHALPSPIRPQSARTLT
jgi:hypothetical protein